MANSGIDALEKLEVWKRGCRLAVDVFQILEHSKEYGFRDQITRSALSVPSNIAEGFERDSPREFCRFLKIAKGSSGELRTQLYIAAEVGLLERDTAFSYDPRSR
ncbi:MAG: four helix bundle protein [Pseudomonadota bacterium]